MNDEILRLFSNISQIVMGIAFIAMPILLVRLYQKRKDLPFCQTTMMFCVLLASNGVLMLLELDLFW